MLKSLGIVVVTAISLPVNVIAADTGFARLNVEVAAQGVARYVALVRPPTAPDGAVCRGLAFGYDRRNPSARVFYDTASGYREGWNGDTSAGYAVTQNTSSSEPVPVVGREVVAGNAAVVEIGENPWSGAQTAVTADDWIINVGYACGSATNPALNERFVSLGRFPLTSKPVTDLAPLPGVPMLKAKLGKQFIEQPILKSMPVGSGTGIEAVIIDPSARKIGVVPIWSITNATSGTTELRGVGTLRLPSAVGVYAVKLLSSSALSSSAKEEVDIGTIVLAPVGKVTVKAPKSAELGSQVTLTGSLELSSSSNPMSIKYEWFDEAKNPLGTGKDLSVTNVDRIGVRSYFLRATVQEGNLGESNPLVYEGSAKIYFTAPSKIPLAVVERKPEVLAGEKIGLSVKDPLSGVFYQWVSQDKNVLGEGETVEFVAKKEGILKYQLRAIREDLRQAKDPSAWSSLDLNTVVYRNDPPKIEIKLTPDRPQMRVPATIRARAIVSNPVPQNRVIQYYWDAAPLDSRSAGSNTTTSQDIHALSFAPPGKETTVMEFLAGTFYVRLMARTRLGQIVVASSEPFTVAPNKPPICTFEETNLGDRSLHVRANCKDTDGVIKYLRWYIHLSYRDYRNGASGASYESSSTAIAFDYKAKNISSGRYLLEVKDDSGAIQYFQNSYSFP